MNEPKNQSKQYKEGFPLTALLHLTTTSVSLSWSVELTWQNTQTCRLERQRTDRWRSCARPGCRLPLTYPSLRACCGEGEFPLATGDAILTQKREEKVKQRRAAFKRVEVLLGTHDTTKLPRCYANTDRESIYVQGLKMGKAILQDMMRYKHDVFLWITPRCNLINAR